MKPAAGWIRNVTETNFEQDVLLASDSVPVIVDFWAPWCQPCRTLGPILERLVNERKGEVILAKVNTEEAQRLAAYFRIESIPAIKVFFQRQIVHEFEGLAPESALRQFIQQLCEHARGAGPGEEPAEQEIEGEDPVEAERRYSEMLAAEPEKLEARIGLARALLAQGKLDDVPAVLEPVGSAGDLGEKSDSLLAQVYLHKEAQGLPDLASLRRTVEQEPNNARARLDLGIRLAAAGDYEQALAMLFSAGELDFGLLTSKVKEVMVKVFYAVGSSKPLANDYRSRLTRLLY